MADDVLRERLTAQLLAGEPATAVVDVVDRLLAVQAQDPRGARLTVRSRSTGLKAADVDRALNDASLVISTLNRGTLHLVRREDYWWLHELTTPQLHTGSKRRLQQERVSPADAERGVAVIKKALADGPMARDDLRDAIAAAGIRVEGQAFFHVVFAATLQGLIVRGPMIGNDHSFVLVNDWLGRPPAFDRDRALAELARRYLAGHGPADEADLARWAGINIGDARRGFAAISGHLADRDDGLAVLKTGVAAAPLPAPRLLGSFEPVLLGWRSREAIVGTQHELVTTNGLFRPFAMVDGKAVGTWGLAGGKVTMKPLGRISKITQTALNRDAVAVLDFLG